MAVLGLGLLAGIAFLVGALAGLVWKEPGLLVAYLRGETTEIAWTTSEGALPVAAADAVVPATAGEPAQAVAPKPAVATAPVAAAPKPAPKAAPVKKAQATPPKPAAAPPAVAAAPPPPAAMPARIAVQVGAFGERGAAERLRADLQSDGLPAYVAAAAGEDTPRWRVRVGPYPSRDEAEGVAAQLKRNRRLPTWVLDEDAE